MLLGGKNVGDMLDEKIFEAHKEIKKKFDEKHIAISFKTIDKKECCIVKQDHYKFGVPGDTREKAFLEAAAWVLDGSNRVILN